MPRHSSQVTRKCECCGNEFRFQASPSAIREKKGRFCSKACHYRWMAIPAVIRTCEVCGNEFAFNATPCVLRQGGAGRFCSNECKYRRGGVPVETRFLRYVGLPNDDGCILWTGHTNQRGYGVIYSGSDVGRMLLAHRVAYEVAHGAIPQGMDVLHHCDNPPCCNPEHLFLGTNQDNIDDMKAKGRGNLGSRHAMAKLDEVKVQAIRKRYAAGGISQEKLGRDYGVVRTVISRIVNREIWRHI